MAVILGSSIVTGIVFGQTNTSVNPELLKTRTITASELKSFDGKDGRPAYFAYNGLVYDVTRSPWWKEGKHPGDNFAGNDLSGRLAGAPHGEEVFNAFRVVGILEGGLSETPDSEKRASRPTGLILIFGKTLTAWSGYALGIVLILNFWTCCVMPWRSHLLPWKGIRPGPDKDDEKGFFHLTMIHRPIAWATIILGTLHGVLGIFQSFGIYI